VNGINENGILPFISQKWKES
jgi:hypothetical protein